MFIALLNVLILNNLQLEQHHKEILEDITQNLTNNQFRVRISCCLALSDLIKSPNVSINYVECAPGLWKQLFRVMDDIHEGTRQEATNTAKTFSRVSYILRLFLLNAVLFIFDF